ncbi:MAG: DegT/DnrJ/EryC1/StrS family aminotransferase [Clostridia bacterium]|nr:DegT/DnrJ/EryC1/StrS family aminotransferase [Clostridia bacterium]
MSKLALFGGEKTLDHTKQPDELFRWPIFTEEDETALLDVFRKNEMSGNNVTIEFEKEFAEWQERKYAVACCNGTLSLLTAMFALGLKAGDELICPTKTYWASCLSAQLLGVSVVFANVDPDTLCIAPDDLERLTGPRTKAIMVVHYKAYPCDMDRIMTFARKHDLKVIEDVSHAQGGHYRGRKLGTFGDVAAMSLMSGKSLACGELGILVTDDRLYYERALAFLHYERNKPENISSQELLSYVHLPLSGLKGRANQLCTAIGRVQLRYYDERIAEVRRANNYFFDRLEGLPGIRTHRVDEKDGSDMAGWYTPCVIYRPEELGGLSVGTFIKALTAETNFPFNTLGGNFPLHLHPMFNTYDHLGLGRPSRIAFSERDVRELDKALKPSENIIVIDTPYFRKLMPEQITLYADAFRKVIANHSELLAADSPDAVNITGQWYGQVK